MFIAHKEPRSKRMMSQEEPWKLRKAAGNLEAKVKVHPGKGLNE
jgi:hypothetical protein